MKQDKTRAKTLWRVFKFTILFTFIIFIIAFGAVTAAFLHLYKNSPDVSDLPNRIDHQTSVIYDRTGTHMLYELHGDENRKVLTHDQIPDIVRQTTVAAEDKNFYSHPGFDIFAIFRAAKANYEHKQLAQGASTITQQLARNSYLGREKTFSRKISEILLAIKIEKTFTKDQILDMYLNKVSYGSNTYGIETASEMYFHKQAKDLTLDEAAFLAALPKAPSYYAPSGENVDQTLERQQYVLNRMKDLHLASDDQIAQARQVDTLAKVQKPIASIDAPHFVFYVIDQLKKQYGEDKIEQGGWKIITSLDYDLQQKAEQVVKDGAARNVVQHNAQNAALVAIDPKTGEVLAMVGSRDFYDSKIDSQVNVATSLRQPGSSFKPIVYATAFEEGFQPETGIYDVRINFGPDGSGRDYIPRDYDGKFRGLINMRQALSMSLNVPAVQALYWARINNVISTAQKFGITTLDPNRKYGLSLALGSGEVKLVDLTGAYGVFANDGMKVPVTPIKEIIDAKGNIIYQNRALGNQIISSQTARKISSILSDTEARKPVFGRAVALTIPDKTVAVKTGTSQDYRDDWTVGYTPDIVVGVWTGNNDHSKLKTGSAGAYVAAPIWKDFLQAYLSDKPDKPFPDYNQVDTHTQIAVLNNYSNINSPQYDRNNGGDSYNALAENYDQYQSGQPNSDTYSYQPSPSSYPPDYQMYRQYRAQHSKHKHH